MAETDLEARTMARRRRWRRLSRAVSTSLSAVAVGGAVYLGATGPSVSPVQPATAVVAAAPPQVAPDGREVGREDRGGRGDDRGDAGRRR